MSMNKCLMPAFLALFLVTSCAVHQNSPGGQLVIPAAIDLAGPRSADIHYYRMKTQYIHIGFDGKRTGSETYSFTLRGVPAALSDKGADEYTCGVFHFQTKDSPTRTIPSLAGWSYLFKGPHMDEAGQVLGIPHQKFDGIVDDEGNPLPPNNQYIVYNNFIDFHAFNDVFARPSPSGRGIQHLRHPGQKIVHSAAFSEPPIDLGSATKKGSYFRNGEVTLELKGLTEIEGKTCAIVGYDSGESTLKVLTPFGPPDSGKEMVTTGGSEYLGDLYIDIKTRWVPKVTLNEFVVAETRLPDGHTNIKSYTVRHILVEMISKAEFEKSIESPRR